MGLACNRLTGLEAGEDDPQPGPRRGPSETAFAARLETMRMTTTAETAPSTATSAVLAEKRERI